ncbi:MAG: CYTH domain-containing protein [Wenzhouxiangella sp.]|nr:CYTH domain-containing protein [Wenzhouxiangella sp.]
MGTEIERKFRVTGHQYRDLAVGTRYRQAYLSTDKERVVRVRVVDDQAWLTIKGKTRGVSRAEFEYEIPVTDAVDMLENLCQQPIIDKTRYRLPLAEHVWEIDEFHGVNNGLIVAEIELSSEDESFEKPDWLGEEVSGDPRYFNANLIAHPYRDWSE